MKKGFVMTLVTAAMLTQSGVDGVAINAQDHKNQLVQTTSQLLPGKLMSSTTDSQMVK